LLWHADDQRWLPAGTALRFNPEWSTSWKQHLTDVHEREPSDVAAQSHPLVYEASVAGVRDLGMRVEHTPQGRAPNECAHASTWYRAGDEQPTKPERAELRNALARSLRLVHGTVTLSPPPGA
jgi:hypothetical protein